MGNANPEDRSARPSAFAKLFYFMRPDKGRMILSLAMACIGETLGMVPYIVIAVLAAGLLEGTLSSARRYGSPPPRPSGRWRSSSSRGARR